LYRERQSQDLPTLPLPLTAAATTVYFPIPLHEFPQVPANRCPLAIALNFAANVTSRERDEHAFINADDSMIPRFCIGSLPSHRR
jgi:hypothetical protein